MHNFCVIFFFFFKQKTAYEMRISDWSSDVCSSDLSMRRGGRSRRPICPAARGSCSRTPTGSRSRSILPDATGDRQSPARDRKSVVEGKSVSVRVDLGGRRIIKKKKLLSYKVNTSESHVKPKVDSLSENDTLK